MPHLPTIALLLVILSPSLATAGDIRWEFSAEESTPLALHGSVHRDVPGPRPPDYPEQAPDNTAVRFDGRGAYLAVNDPGADSDFDFTNGDEITLEALVQVDELGHGENAYIIGKGRTGSDQFARDNQNWALRVRGTDAGVSVSFLFATPRDPSAAASDAHWHRWTSTGGFRAGPEWHHVAVAYRFGEPDSMTAWIDGQAQQGSWDMGGPTKNAPLVDDDAVWIGSAQRGAASNSFRGALDSIAIHRRRLPDSTITGRFLRNVTDRPIAPAPEIAPEIAGLEPGQAVLIIHEAMPSQTRWLNDGESLPAEASRVTLPAMLLNELPRRYDDWGIRDSWKAPVLVRLATRVTLPPGRNTLLARVRGLSRLWVNGQVIARAEPLTGSPSGEEPVTPLPEPPLPGYRRAEHRQQELIGHADIAADGEAIVVLETLVGGKAFRADPGETLVAVLGPDEQSWSLLCGGLEARLIDPNVESVLAKTNDELHHVNDHQRRTAAARHDEYWDRRHAAARAVVDAISPPMSIGNGHPIDEFLSAKATNSPPGDAPPTLSDAAFIRRVAFDTIGIPLAESDVRAFLVETSSDKRLRLIDRLLADERCADHWMGEWQDLLAENPTLINASLNTTGPFRGFLYDSFRDNKSWDRLVTELILLRGSAHEGGSAGFALAGDNDAPLAAKAQILTQAFLGVEMQCARCHDAPFHSSLQTDLYGLAAMLDRKPASIPSSSRVPAAFFDELSREPQITVSIQPNESVPPHWPLAGITGCADDPSLDEWLHEPSDSRERLAALITSPPNRRFPRVMVNRIWRRFMGCGIVEPPQDWEATTPSHPELLNWLAQEFVRADYDWKPIARLILTSQVYQREAHGRNRTMDATERLFVSPDRRRLTAEQIVDTLVQTSGRPLDVEEFTFDPDGRRPASNRQTLGIPRRAWEFTSLANERDRATLNLPKAQALADLLLAFGWTGSRQSPINDRESAPNVLQPGVLSNSLAATHLTRAAAGSTLAQLAVDANSPEDLVRSLTLRYLSRNPTEEELVVLSSALADGFKSRVVDQAPVESIHELPPLPAVTWSNHLRTESNEIAAELERRAQLGPPVDPRLDNAWRETYEDVVWSLVNLPEFVWLE